MVCKRSSTAQCSPAFLVVICKFPAAHCSSAVWQCTEGAPLPAALWQCAEGAPKPIAPQQCGSVRTELHCPLLPSSVVVYVRSPIAHCP